MIINIDILENVYKCKKEIMEYLIYDCHIPLLGYDSEKYYYFDKTDELLQCLKKMPLHLKFIALFTKQQ